MAIGTAAALLGSAVIGGGASIIGASKNANAINSATNAQTQLSRESLALQEKYADEAHHNLSPFMTSGYNASNNLNALLGLPGYDQSTARDGFNAFLDSAGFNTNLNEQNKAANAQFAATGALDSGAAVKAAQDRYLGLKGNYLTNYLGLLGNQQQTGLGAASAAAGVGQTFANNATNINTNMGNALAQGSMAKASNTNALLGNLSSSFGLGLGALSGFGTKPNWALSI